MAAKTVNQFLEGKVLSPYVISLCRDLWNAATDAAEEKFKSTKALAELGITPNNARVEICGSCGSAVKSHWKYCQECKSSLSAVGRKLSPIA
jgi:hypothetical protein